MKKSYDFNIPVLLSPLKNNANKLDGETLQKFRVNRMASDTGKHHTQDPMHLLKKDTEVAHLQPYLNYKIIGDPPYKTCLMPENLVSWRNSITLSLLPY